MATVTLGDEEIEAHIEAIHGAELDDAQENRYRYLDLLESGCLPNDLEQDENGRWRVKEFSH